MNIEKLKNVLNQLLEKVRKYPVFTRILTQAVLFITTFQLHTSSPFWHVVCLGCMILTTTQNVLDGKAKKALLEKSDEVVEILTDALTDMVQSGSVEISEVFTEEVVSDVLMESKETKEELASVEESQDVVEPISEEAEKEDVAEETEVEKAAIEG